MPFFVGIEVLTPDGKFIAKALLLQLSVDLPARALVTNTKQFNGRFGCLYCYNPGTVEPGKPLHRFWPQIASSTIRTSNSFHDDVVKAVTDGEAVR